MNLIHSTTGFFHVATALGAMVLGTLVLVRKKGTPFHRFLGYGYFYSMLAMNISSFALTGLTGSFGPFHVAAVSSLLTLIAGIIPAIRRKPARKWIMIHGTFMYFSVVGLYAAFFSELFTRIPHQPFYTMVFMATAGVTIAGTLLYIKWKPKWLAQFNS